MAHHNFVEAIGKWLMLFGGIWCGLLLDASQVDLYVAHSSLKGHQFGYDSQSCAFGRTSDIQTRSEELSGKWAEIYFLDESSQLLPIRSPSYSSDPDSGWAASRNSYIQN